MSIELSANKDAKILPSAFFEDCNSLELPERGDGFYVPNEVYTYLDDERGAIISPNT